MDEDRISQLPDEILQQILSFIDSYEAIQTTIISKRWKNLWRSLPSLRFHLRRGLTLTNEKDKIDFSHFVSHFLSHRDAAAPVHDFHLSLDTIFKPKIDKPFVEEWVLYAINHGVHSLRLRTYNDLRLPSALFTSTTLREIKLELLYNEIHVPGRFLLPKLKTLYLHCYLIFDDDNEMEMFSGLPELEKLSLRKCDRLNGLVLKAPKLRVLEILDCWCVIQEISAPLLTSFRYQGSSPLECLKMNLPMLEQVYVDIYNIDENVKELHRMLHQLGNATTVSLTLDTRKVLQLNGGPIEQSHPPFPNHKCLKVMKGRYKIRTVLQSVMNYSTIGNLYFETMKESPDVTVVEKNPEDLCDDEDYKRMSLFLTR